MRRTLVASLPVVMLLIGVCGCRHNQHRAADVDPSTVGRTRSLYPRGTTIPPSGIGVDLVNRNGATVDPSASPASAQPE